MRIAQAKGGGSLRRNAQGVIGKRSRATLLLFFGDRRTRSERARPVVSPIGYTVKRVILFTRRRLYAPRLATKCSRILSSRGGPAVRAPGADWCSPFERKRGGDIYKGKRDQKRNVPLACSWQRGSAIAASFIMFSFFFSLGQTFAFVYTSGATIEWAVWVRRLLHFKRKQ